MKTLITLLLLDATLALICALCLLPLVGQTGAQIGFPALWLAAMGVRQLQGGLPKDE